MTSTDADQLGYVTQQAAERDAPAPGAESVGPPLTPLVSPAAWAADVAERLHRIAAFDLLRRTQLIGASGNTDANGDAAVHLFTVPAGSHAYLTWLCVDMPGVTATAPDTSASLWHGIYGAQSGIVTLAQLLQAGQQLDSIPNTPGTDAQIPFTYLYGGLEAAPTLSGPMAFYLAVDAATAARQLVIRGKCIVHSADH